MGWLWIFSGKINNSVKFHILVILFSFTKAHENLLAYEIPSEEILSQASISTTSNKCRSDTGGLLAISSE